MQIRAITKNGKKLSARNLLVLEHSLARAIDRAGFDTNVEIKNSSRIDVSSGGYSYATINVAKRGYNYRVNSSTEALTKSGFKRTNVLTWDQRCELNDLINDVLDRANISATIQSRECLVRHKTFGPRRYFPEPQGCTGFSFQPNFHDWIYSDEIEAHKAVSLYYRSPKSAPVSLTLIAGGGK